MIKCPNGCRVIPDAIAHTCTAHKKAIAEGRPFKCKIKNCKLEATMQSGSNPRGEEK